MDIDRPQPRGHHSGSAKALLDWGADSETGTFDRLIDRRGNEEPGRVSGPLVKIPGARRRSAGLEVSPLPVGLTSASWVRTLADLSVVASVIGGISGGRKEQRILEVVQGVSDDLSDFKSQVAEEYVKTEDFEELLENTLRRVAQERSAEKRRLYRSI
jgi:hypothetical protein